MKLKVNDCGQCQFIKIVDNTTMYCRHLGIVGNSIIHNPDVILKNCPLKTKPVTIQIKSRKNESKT